MAGRAKPGHVEPPGRTARRHLQRADRSDFATTSSKNGFPGIVLGLSGGVDSALSAAIAVDALGPERVLGVRLPSPFTGQVSMEEAQFVADRLGIRLLTLPIERVMTNAEDTLAPVFEERPRDVTEENLQARIRGLLLMALSNKFGSMLLTTGNKSEMSVGYATLVRRHVRRIFGAEGHLQDRSLSTVAMAQREPARRSRRARREK